MHGRANELVELLSQECNNLQDVHDLLKQLFKETIEQMLEAEMDEHLGYEKHSPVGDLTGNSRYGYNKKTIQTQMGKTELKIPRDRNGKFEPRLIEKYQTKSSNLEQQIIAMYAKGMSTRDIEDHLRDIYGIDASPVLISRITDKIMPAVSEIAEPSVGERVSGCVPGRDYIQNSQGVQNDQCMFLYSFFVRSIGLPFRMTVRASKSTMTSRILTFLSPLW